MATSGRLSTSNNNDSKEMMSERSVTSTGGEEGTNLSDLFGEIDWSTVNLGELAERWRQELAEIEEENVRTLMDITNKSQAVLPVLVKAIDEVGAVDELLADYCQRLQVMGAEIQQIEQLNRGLNLQTANQQTLLRELDSLLVSCCCVRLHDNTNCC